ncbi:hypothetical protein ACSUZJ_23470 [Telluria sp. B2]
MIPVLTADSYRGFSVSLPPSELNGAQPVFVGRLVWPGNSDSSDAVIKLYESNTCGVANEVIGFIANQARGVEQPSQAAIVLLSETNLAGIGVKLKPFVDKSTGLIACWATSLEQSAVPFKYVRQLSTFTAKQTKVFLQSKFCKILSSVDHVTGNNDRHEGNFLYVDDLKYLAIDQGCVGGGIHWHTTWPLASPRNELVELANRELPGSMIAAWASESIFEHNKTQGVWGSIEVLIRANLEGLLDHETAEIILNYMSGRAVANTFATSCGRLI